MLRKLAFVLVGVVLLAGLGWRFVTHWTPSRTTFPTQGIDVSQEQGLIDWKAARAAGVDFAYIRASQGSDRRDENFAANWSESAAADVKRGAYHVFNLCKPGREQATNFIALVPRGEQAERASVAVVRRDHVRIGIDAPFGQAAARGLARAGIVQDRGEPVAPRIGQFKKMPDHHAASGG